MPPEVLESPLDGLIERLRVEVEHTDVDELAKHPTERRLRQRQISSFAPLHRRNTAVPRFYIRATVLNQHISMDDFVLVKEAKKDEARLKQV